MPMDKFQQHSQALEIALQQMVELHEQLLDLLQRKRDALRRGNQQAMTELCGLENEKLQQLSELEKQRAAVAAQLTLQVMPQATAPLRVGELADRLEEPARGRLLVLRQQLIERMQQVREAATVARRATEALARHVRGLVQTVSLHAADTSTYAGNGSPAEHGAAVRTLNVTA